MLFEYILEYNKWIVTKSTKTPRFQLCQRYLIFSGFGNVILSVESQKGVIADQRCSVENQKGAIADHRCSVENQKGTIAIDFVQR